jgi:hypothetical protein
MAGNTSDADWLEGWSGTTLFGDAKGPELHGKNHRIRGTDTCLNDRLPRAGHLTQARKRAPADLSCQGEGIGDVHGQTTGRKRPRERGGVFWRE